VKTLLICHHNEPLNRVGMARWLASFSQLAGIIEIREPIGRLWRRVQRESRRVGAIRFLDVLAFRLYQRWWLAGRDRAFEVAELERLCATYPSVDGETPVLVTSSPNSPEAEAFIRRVAPDVALARCKTLLRKEVFSLPPRGTFVLHPGICPEYRNAHGCFWALANDDLHNVGATLLRIDDGVDTGPVYGYFGYRFDEVSESPAVIHNRVVLENLDAIRDRMLDVVAGRVHPLDTSLRPSAAWGQPWLTSYVRWKYRARQRRYRDGTRAHVP
jgi:formyl transferase-like protein